MTALTYAVITPARDEVGNLPRLVESLRAQTVRSVAWMIVDNGSTDGTLELARRLAGGHRWIHVLEEPGSPNGRPERGAPIVRAFHAGLAALPSRPDVLINVDADVSMAPDYFERLVGAFAADPRLGIASGRCHEWEDGSWIPTHVTGYHVRGATRAYRWACLQAVLPLEERFGWDGIDEVRANAAGWRTGTIADLAFYHHRPIGQRDAGRRDMWDAAGRVAHYLRYRPSYLLLRAVHQARRDRSALAMISGYLRAAAAGQPPLADSSARSWLREQQRLRHLRSRAQEALGSG